MWWFGWWLPSSPARKQEQEEETRAEFAALAEKVRGVAVQYFTIGEAQRALDMFDLAAIMDERIPTPEELAAAKLGELY